MEIPIHENEKKLLPPADWAVEIERLQDVILKERDRSMRALADFKNFRHRVEREGNKITEQGKREMMLPLLDIVDDMEKALKYTTDLEQPFVQGVQSIYQKFLALLEKYGVRPFESVGTPFNPNLHEAVATVKHKGSKPEIVVDELRRGYLWNNELLRPAQVRVAE
jgi:molecular chaperone GrpE